MRRHVGLVSVVRIVPVVLFLISVACSTGRGDESLPAPSNARDYSVSDTRSFIEPSVDRSFTLGIAYSGLIALVPETVSVSNKPITTLTALLVKHDCHKSYLRIPNELFENRKSRKSGTYLAGRYFKVKKIAHGRLMGWLLRSRKLLPALLV